jgi:hypothetical protein
MKKLLNFIKSKITRRTIISIFVSIIAAVIICYTFVQLFQIDLTAHSVSVECVSLLAFIATFKFIVSAILEY